MKEERTQIAGFFGSYLSLVERFPGSVRLILDGVVLNEMITFHRGFPGYQETVTDLRHREIFGRTWLWS